MVLPIVSMEDEELFPKNLYNLREPINRQIMGEYLEKFLDLPDQIWWSRLVISSRGYVLNNVDKRSDEQLFSLDDAFILIHKVFVERSGRLSPMQFINHLNTLFSIPNLMDILNRVDPSNFGYNETHPFFEHQYSVSFEALFGNPHNTSNLRMANLQKFGYDVFARLLGILLNRYSQEQQSNQRRIRFNKDPEWQADDRVVLFENFYQELIGNRTWVLLDFDRYILDYWRPNGVQVIFGDSYLDKKRVAGFNLCDFCGMLEQMPNQFPQYKEKRFCSENCFTALLDNRSS